MQFIEFYFHISFLSPSRYGIVTIFERALIRILAHALSAPVFVPVPGLLQYRRKTGSFFQFVSINAKLALSVAVSSVPQRLFLFQDLDHDRPPVLAIEFLF